MATVEDRRAMKEWERLFHKKREEIIKKYNLKTPEEIISFFKYTNLSKKEPDFCPLYKKGEVCHTGISKEELVCYYCACPYYDTDYYDSEHEQVGRCLKKSLRGGYNNAGYWNCTYCTLPHRELSALRILKLEMNKHSGPEFGREK